MNVMHRKPFTVNFY